MAAGALADLTLVELLERLAERRPSPGGGSAVGWAAGLAACLVEMSSALALTSAGSAAAHVRLRIVGERATALRWEVLAAAEREVQSRALVQHTSRLPRSVHDRDQRIAQAQSQAADAPLAIAQIAAEIAELGAETVRRGGRHAQGDAIASVLLAEAAGRAAGRLAALDLAALPEDVRQDELHRCARRAALARDEVLEAVLA